MKFTNEDLKKLWKPREDSSGEDNGQVTIIGGSRLVSWSTDAGGKSSVKTDGYGIFGSPERDLEKVAQ